MVQYVNINLCYYPEEARRFAHDTHIASMLSITGSESISLQKLYVNLSSCLNLFSLWEILSFMIAILVLNGVYKYCYVFPKVEFYDYDFVLFCYGVLMTLCFYLKNPN